MTLTFDLSNPKTTSFLCLKVIPYTKLEHFGIIRFYVRQPCSMHVLYRLSVCLSVCLSVTRWYCIRMAEFIVTLSSPHDNPFILVLCVYKIFAKFWQGHPLRGGGQNRGGVWKCRNFRPITCYISEMVEDRWVYTARCFTSIESSSNRVTYTAIFLGAYPGESKMWEKRSFTSRGLLKINHSPPIYRCISEMVEGRWVYAASIQPLNPLSIHVTFTAIVPGAYPGSQNVPLWLSCGSQMPPPAKRVKASMYRRDSPEV